MNSVIHIAPQLPPAFDGVGDYCWNLWRHWPERDTRLQFAVLRGASAAQRAWPAVTVHGFDPSAESLCSTLEASCASTAVLHYVGYGYQPKGIPLWLPAALEEWRDSSHPERRLVTMFHEMYARSGPLRSPFWVKPWAIRIIRDLVDCSDAWVTNCASYRQWLISEFEADPDCGTLIPIGSNIPTATELREDRLWPRLIGGKLRVVIFGLPNTRIWALQKHCRLLRQLVAVGLIESISLLGKSSADRHHLKLLQRFKQQIGGEWRTGFDLSANEMAEALAAGDIGFIANDGGTLTKSGVFAAMATNGVVCVIASGGRAALPSAWAECILVNEDQEESSWSAIATELADINRMTTRRRITFHLARTELAWSHVAARWQQILTDAVRVTTIQRVAATRRLPARQEVRA